MRFTNSKEFFDKIQAAEVYIPPEGWWVEPCPSGCTKCTVGNLVASGEGFMSNPPKWANYCDNCGQVTLKSVKYGTPEEKENLRNKLKAEW